MPRGTKFAKFPGISEIYVDIGGGRGLYTVYLNLLRGRERSKCYLFLST